MEVEVGEARVFLSNKGAEAFKKGVRQVKEKVERRGWGDVCKHLELGRRALVKEFYTNLGEKRNLTCYVKGRWVPFEESVIS